MRIFACLALLMLAVGTIQARSQPTQLPEQTVTNAATALAGKPVQVRLWTTPPVLSGGYTDLSGSITFISPDLYGPLLRLVSHHIVRQGAAMDWAAQAVLILSHEVGHLRGIGDGGTQADEAAAECFGIQNVSRLLSLLGVHGAPHGAALNAAVRAYALTGDVPGTAYYDPGCKL